ncbi:MAG: HNH endonuclease [Oscillospiraceae bacterium]|nr:HNH endonuclease [Oscillospiraceae bacterium]
MYEDLSVHHIDPLEQRWEGRLEDENLLTLCRACHELAEAGKLDPKWLHELASKAPSMPGTPRG